MLAQYSTTTSGSGPSGALLLAYLAIYVVQVIGMWRVFEKAGKPGWAAIIPVYNFYVLCKIAGRPGWWWVLLLIPIVNIVIGFIVAVDAAKAFGKSAGYGIGLGVSWLAGIFSFVATAFAVVLSILGAIFWLMLGFGDDAYIGAGGGGYGTSAAPPPPPPPPGPSSWS